MKPEREVGGQVSPLPAKKAWGRFSLVVKLNLTLGLAFLFSMGLFLFLAYRAEKAFEMDHSIRLLSATLEALAAGIPQPQNLDSEELRSLEARLNAVGLHRHLLFLVGPEGRIVAASEPEYQTKTWARAFNSAQDELARGGGALASRGPERWLLVGKRLPSRRTLYLLLDWGHIASNLRDFWTLHGIHVVATLGLFSLLLWIATEKFVRAPLTRLVTAIRWIEIGRWEPDLEIHSQDELAWLYRRLEQMGKRLKANVEHLVRAEKYAAAAMIVLRVGNRMRDPLIALESEIRRLADVVRGDLTLTALATNMEQNRKQIAQTIRELSEIQHPAEWEV